MMLLPRNIGSDICLNVNESFERRRRKSERWIGVSSVSLKSVRTLKTEKLNNELATEVAFSFAFASSHVRSEVNLTILD
ncbi:MAG: hypothetical protein ACTS68_00430 [Candidatus Hodgkinia cicadicola]